MVNLAAVSSEEFELLVEGLQDWGGDPLALSGSQCIAVDGLYFDGSTVNEIQSHAAVVWNHIIGMIDHPVDITWVDLRPVWQAIERTSSLILRAKRRESGSFMIASVLAFRITDRPLKGMFHMSFFHLVVGRSSVRWHSMLARFMS